TLPCCGRRRHLELQARQRQRAYLVDAHAARVWRVVATTSVALARLGALENQRPTLASHSRSGQCLGHSLAGDAVPLARARSSARSLGLHRWLLRAGASFGEAGFSDLFAADGRGVEPVGCLFAPAALRSMRARSLLFPYGRLRSLRG